jgi:hypothetical protein
VRLLLSCLLMIVSMSAVAFVGDDAPKVEGPAPQFSAFILNNNLYVTIMTDGCNVYSPRLVVEGLCDKTRLEENIAPAVCKANLGFMTTKMACGRDTKPEAKVMALDLVNNTNLDMTNFTGLELTYGQATILVRAK